MSVDEQSEIRQNNGRIVMEALKFLEKPETIGNVVKHVARTHEVDAKDIKEPILRTLNTGVKYGFIEKNRLRYGIPRNIEPETLATKTIKRGSMSSYASKSRSKTRGKSRSRSKPRKSAGSSRSRTASRAKSTTRSRGKSMSGKSRSRSKSRKSPARRK